MSNYPEIYKNDEIEKMFEEFGMSSEKRELLSAYFKAFSHLYGIITLEKAYYIINKQNPGMFSAEEFLEFAEIERHAQRHYAVSGNEEFYDDVPESEPMQRKIIAEWLYAVDAEDFYTMEELQKGKSYYVPEKQELLEYANDHYFESTPHMEAILGFLSDEMGCDEQRVYDLSGDIFISIQANVGDCQVPFMDMARMKLRFSAEQAVRFAELYIDLFNNSRQCFNRGYTPAEMKKRALPFASPKAHEEYIGYFENDVCSDPEGEAIEAWKYWERNRKMFSNLGKSIKRKSKKYNKKKNKKKKK